jgi:hypothetical protein
MRPPVLCFSFGLALLAAAPLGAAVVPVSSAAQLIAAIDGASPGDVITLAPGTYSFSQNLLCDTAGTADAPIRVRAENFGDALLRFDMVEGFKVSAPHWIFENLDIEGICASHSNCEHAFHLFNQAEHTRIRDCRLRDFNAQVKSNGEGNPFLFPDDVVIERSELANRTARSTSNPVTPIDIVGGRRWIVRSNFIHDHQKAGGDTISYAAFFKGNSRDGLFERNLVICELDHRGGVRLGLSLGGGGTGPDSICEDGSCNPEHQNGTLRNNIIVSCPADVGIYLNEATNTRVFHNTLIETTGIDVRFVASTAEVRNNLVSGLIRNRDGGTSTQSNNLSSLTLGQYQGFFADPLLPDLSLLNGTSFVDLGTTVPVAGDYCGLLRRSSAADRGALEYPVAAPCDTSMPGGGADIFFDGFETGGTGQWSLRMP